MFAKCANPDCEKLFDYRQGQLIRFCRSELNGPSAANQHIVEHFWLCGSCSELYVLLPESENIRMKLRADEFTPAKAHKFAVVA